MGVLRVPARALAQRSAAVMLVLLLGWLHAPAAAADATLAQRSAPAPGRLLVASRTLGDPNFGQSVVLLINYGPTGALGVIVNRPLNVTVAASVPALAEALGAREDPLYFGGPVVPGALLTLLRRDTPPPDEGLDERNVFGRVYLGGSIEQVREFIRDSAGEAVFRAYSGYAGWAPGQLDAEISRGDWLITDADEASVFADEPLSVWPGLIQRHDGTWARLPLAAPPIAAR